MSASMINRFDQGTCLLLAVVHAPNTPTHTHLYVFTRLPHLSTCPGLLIMIVGYGGVADM